MFMYMKVLIVDDSRIVQRAISSVFAGLEIDHITCAPDGTAALEQFARTEPDLVTLDITMPGMDGLACLERMMHLRPEVHVLVISALNDRATGLRALKLGARGFVSKPFSNEELAGEIHRILPAGVT